jgi:hypothetical protein
MKNGICGHCGEAKPLGVRWHGRSPLDTPPDFCKTCERAYPVGWSRRQIADAAERSTTWATEQAEAKADRDRNYPRKRISDAAGHLETA